MHEKIQHLCRYIEAHCDQPLRLEEMSQRLHVSRFHLQRSFKAAVGVTPRQYQEACRLKRLKAGLQQGNQDGSVVTKAILDAGYGSASRVYERAAEQLGMTPKQYQKGGRNISISYACADTALGLLMLGATDRGLCFVQFGAGEEALFGALSKEFPHAALNKMACDSNHFQSWIQALNAYLTGTSELSTFPVELQGTAFQIKVWRYLQTIPHGNRKTYTQVAEGIGHPSAVRAVANACAANRLALLIPCHRVIRGDGGMGGYRWGMERKKKLLTMEQAHLADQES